MRRDQQIETLLEQEKQEERGSACCIYNDQSGCVQTISDDNKHCSVSDHNTATFLQAAFSPFFIFTTAESESTLCALALCICLYCRLLFFSYAFYFKILSVILNILFNVLMFNICTAHFLAFSAVISLF